MREEWNLYRIGAGVERLIEMYEDDEISQEEADALYARLMEERDATLADLARVYLNCAAQAEVCRTEMKRLSERKSDAERLQERIRGIMGRELGQKRTDLGFCTVKFTKSQYVDFDDPSREEEVLAAIGKEYPELVKTERSLRKKEAKDYLRDGVFIEGVGLHDRVSCSIR